MSIPDNNGLVLAPVEQQTGQLGPDQGVAPGAAPNEVPASAEDEGGEGAGEDARCEDEADAEAAVHCLLEEPHDQLHREDTDQVQPGAVHWTGDRSQQHIGKTRSSILPNA